MTNESRPGLISRRRRWLWRGIAVLATIAAAGLIVFRVASLRGEAPAPDVVLPAVAIEMVREEQLDIFRDYTGTIAARHRFAVAAQVNGTVLSVPKREGERVLAGDLLAQLDATEFRAEVARLEATIERSEADLEYWQAQLTRYRSLLASQAVSQQTLDETERQARNVAASLKEARQSLLQARTRLGYTEIHAPSDGFVQAVYVQPGDLAGASKPLVELVDERALKVIVALPQSDLVTLSLESPATVTVGGRDRAIEAQLDRLYPALETSTRTATGEVFLPESVSGLRPGMLATVSIRLARIDAALTVPMHAVQSRQGASGVFVLEEGLARWYPVRTGYTVGQRVQVVDGLASGSNVIVTPDSRLTDGMAVNAAPRVAAR